LKNYSFRMSSENRKQGLKLKNTNRERNTEE
jgi:hypothetical protein